MKSIVKAKKKATRRYGANIWGESNASFVKRETAPGQHGARKKKMTDYGTQLYAKQRMKASYGNISEKQFAKYYAVFAARQFVNHNHILVNGKKVNIPSYMVKAGDVIEIKEKSRQLPMVLAAVEATNRDVPGYLEVDSKKMTAKYSFVPKFDDVPYACTMEPNLVIEYYSR